MEDFEGDCSLSLSSLICLEDESCFDDEEGSKKELSFSLNAPVPMENDDEYIKMLVSKEMNLEIKDNRCEQDCPNDRWLKCSRFSAVQWMLKMRTFFGFHVQTVSLSVTYLDQFLSRRAINEKGRSWAIWLLSIACLSLSAKMHESEVPSLLDYRVEEYEFERKVIQKMELLVLDTLEWKMCLVTPFVYLNYFISKFTNEAGVKASQSEAVELILATMEVVNVLSYRPSVIAAAAVLATSNQRLTMKLIEFKIGEMSSFGPLNTEHVFSCYNLMMELEERRLTLLKNEISLDLQLTETSSMDVLGDDSFTFVGTKRKRVILNSCARDHCLVDKK
eukprot:TRINITY_DN10868_c0_g1_i2.p1 TRINITY_DN10868_c0_g1~~TRINITY_DN10868_c0_g1_i2.p1  ORF type:complete len:334 (+),score=73.80 TRINITY_DN10868_c0_g1_i2:603-1604(+)